MPEKDFNFFLQIMVSYWRNEKLELAWNWPRSRQKAWTFDHITKYRLKTQPACNLRFSSYASWRLDSRHKVKFSNATLRAELKLYKNSSYFPWWKLSSVRSTLVHHVISTWKFKICFLPEWANLQKHWLFLHLEWFNSFTKHMINLEDRSFLFDKAVHGSF